MNEGKTEEFELSIVMPCLNEAETIGECVDKAMSFIKQYKINAEIIIGDNGSTDGSQEIAIVHGASVIHVEERGYGSALIGGISAVKSKYVIMEIQTEVMTSKI
jgi:glycosyltransferase involved in cell wall biosynthesis